MNELSLNENYLYAYLSERKDKDNKIETTSSFLQNELSLGRRVLTKTLQLLSSKNIISYSSSNKGLLITILNNEVYHMYKCTNEMKKCTNDMYKCTNETGKCTCTSDEEMALESDLDDLVCTNVQQNAQKNAIYIYKYLLIINNKLDYLLKKDKEREIYKEKEIEKKSQKKFPQDICLEDVVLAFEDFVQSHIDRYPALGSLDVQLESESFWAYWSDRNWKDKSGRTIKSVKGRVATWLSNWLKSFNPKSVTALQQAQAHVETKEQKIARMQREIENGQIFDYQLSEGNVIDGNNTNSKINENRLNFGDMPF